MSIAEARMAGNRMELAMAARLTQLAVKRYPEMIEGLTEGEIDDFADALCRRAHAWSEVPPVQPEPPWSTVSGFADRYHFFSALSRTWPLVPQTGDLIALSQIFHWPRSVIFTPSITIAIPRDELSG